MMIGWNREVDAEGLKDGGIVDIGWCRTEESMYFIGRSVQHIAHVARIDSIRQSPYQGTLIGNAVEVADQWMRTRISER